MYSEVLSSAVGLDIADGQAGEMGTKLGEGKLVGIAVDRDGDAESGEMVGELGVYDELMDIKAELGGENVEVCEMGTELGDGKLLCDGLRDCGAGCVSHVYIGTASED